MNANELRIGNYYNHHEEVKQITPDIIQEVSDAERIWCKPIPLTEEFLCNLGAEKFSGVVWLKLTNLHSELHFEFYGEEIVTILKGKFSDLVLNRIHSVHQLQNLYFALTNEELTIKQ